MVNGTEEQNEQLQNDISIFNNKDEGLQEFIGKPLVDQFSELFQITEDPIGKIIKDMHSKGDDKYASFNPEDVEFFEDAFNDEI